METASVITECLGYQHLLAAVEEDERTQAGFHDYRAKLKWVAERAQHYAEKTGILAAEILDAWEKDRRYWYMNYYQEANQPRIEAGKVRVFETPEDLQAAIGTVGFRCPMCRGVSKSPFECDSKQEMSPGKVCDWKVYGLLGHLGKGVYVFVKSRIAGTAIFMPVAWEGVRP
jgi:hypothetical protein